jgi:UPF0755 protein
MFWLGLKNYCLSLKNHWKLGIIIFLALTVILYVLISPLGETTDFPINSIYTVKKGTGLNSLAMDLKDKNIIKSPFYFKVFSVLFGGTKGIIAGDYVLDEPEGVISLAQRISHGDFKLVPVKITFPEGLNIFEMSKLISDKFSMISKQDFLTAASQSEGYLFPDTYLFLPNITAEKMVMEMKDNYQKNIFTIADLMKNFKKSESDIIKMASILEEEARTEETRRIVADILWRRIAIGMPLQVDASFKYINGKVTKDLSLDDLKNNSPYNSYVYKGLPPTPISNPGLEAIKDALTPIKTDYLYFLTDREGEMHYAKTFAEHVRNKEMYLK